MKNKTNFKTFFKFMIISSILFSISLIFFFVYIDNNNLSSIVGLITTIGIIFGISYGSIMCYVFRIYELSFGLERVDMKTIRSSLLEVGYIVDHDVNSHLIFKPTIRTGILAPEIELFIEMKNIIIIGPKYYVLKIQKILNA